MENSPVITFVSKAAKKVLSHYRKSTPGYPFRSPSLYGAITAHKWVLCGF